MWPPSLYDSNLLQAAGWANVLLAGFNLLPALPLDGGRVLRALVERRTGPLEATRIAARWGRDIAIGMIVFGVLVNVWLVFIGVFVFLASNAEEAGAIVHQRLAGLTVRDLMVRDPAGRERRRHGGPARGDPAHDRAATVPGRVRVG